MECHRCGGTGHKVWNIGAAIINVTHCACQNESSVVIGKRENPAKVTLGAYLDNTPSKWAFEQAEIQLEKLTGDGVELSETQAFNFTNRLAWLCDGCRVEGAQDGR